MRESFVWRTKVAPLTVPGVRVARGGRMSCSAICVRGLRLWLVRVRRTSNAWPACMLGVDCFSSTNALEQLGGRLKSCRPSLRSWTLPCSARHPSPRRAKTSQMRHWFSPLLLIWSANKIAFRPSMKPGLQGWSFIPSMTSCTALLFPPFPLIRSGSHPYLLLMAQYRSQRAAAHISPTGCGTRVVAVAGRVPMISL